jgi:hypothetical protein
VTGATPGQAGAQDAGGEGCTASACVHAGSAHCRVTKCGNSAFSCLPCLRAELAAERDRSAALLVDADRREQRALDLLPDCGAHKREIQYLRHMASWCWESAQRAEEARQAVVSELELAADRVSERAEPVPAHVVAEALRRAAGRQEKALARHGHPTFADCQRRGGCDHDGLSDEVKAGIAEALGLVPAPSGAVLF